MSFSPERRGLHNWLADTTNTFPRPKQIEKIEARLKPRRRVKYPDIHQRIDEIREARLQYATTFGRRGLETGAIAAQAAVQAEVVEPPSYPSVEFITSPPKLRQGRPNQPFLVDDIYPSGELARLNRLSRQELQEASGPYPNTHWRLRSRPNQPITCNSEPADPHEAVSRKRRATATELDLAASTIHAIFTGPPLNFDYPAPRLEDDVVDIVMQTEPKKGLVESVISMFSSVAHALTGFGRKVTRYISNPPHGVAEVRYEAEDGNIVNKRRKLSQPEEYEDEVQWASDEMLESLLDHCNRARPVFSTQPYMSAEYLPHLQGRLNDILRPLGPVLAGSVGHPTPIMTGKTLPRSHCDLYSLFTQELFQLLPKVYDLSKINELKASHGFSLRPRLNLGFSPGHLDALLHIKSVLSFPSLPYILAEFTGEKALPSPNGILNDATMAFVDRLILDIEAILEGLIPPSYLDSPDYLEGLKNRFPAPVRGPVVPPMPGMFPNELQQSIHRPSTAPSEAQNPPEPAQNAQRPATAPAEAEKQPPAPITHNADSPSELAVSRISPISKTTRLRSWAQYVGAVWKREERTKEERDAYRAVKSQYVEEFEPQLPAKDYENLSSILRARLKHPSRTTPKRLKTLKLPKRVRFSASTVSPKPRTHIRSEIPRLKEPDHTIHFSSQGLTFQNVRPASSIFQGSPSPPSTPILRRSHLLPPTPFPPLPPSPTSKAEPRAETEEEKAERVRSLDALFAEPSPISLQLSDLASAALAQRREEEARIAAEAAEAAERAAVEKARLELEARLALTGGLRVPRQKFVPSLSSNWTHKVQETLHVAPSTSLTTTVEGIDLRRHDFAKVVPETEWLNDEIVNGSLMWLDQAINSAAGIKDVKKQTRKCLTMSSFFFKQLREKGVGRTQRTLRRYGVEKRNFLNVDTILLPICERSHWTLLVVRPSKRTVSHMDSMKSVGSTPNTNLALAWIRDVLEDAFVPDEWTVVKHEAPRQTNGWDCGVHTITNAMCIALGLNPIDCYSPEDMPLQRLRIASVLLNRGFSGEFDLGVF